MTIRDFSYTTFSHDTTQSGHVLGDPNGRTVVPTPERNLSPPAMCVLRALMHSSFLWTCCNNDQRIGDIVQLVKPHVPVQALSEFFWRHLDKDIELLGRAVGKGYEEAAMIVHLVLKGILTKDPPGSEFVLLPFNSVYAPHGTVQLPLLESQRLLVPEMPESSGRMSSTSTTFNQCWALWSRMWA